LTVSLPCAYKGIPPNKMRPEDEWNEKYVKAWQIFSFTQPPHAEATKL
jgi:hypothetical protein